MEIWKDVEGYENIYQISDLGNVKSKDRHITYSNGKVVFYESRTKKCAIDKYGYAYVSLYINQKHKQGMIHRLVAQAFIPNTDNKPQVNHINGIKTDNRVENLEWVTAKENVEHAFKNGLCDDCLGENHYKSKFKNEDVINIRKRAEQGETYQSIADDFNVVKSTIGFIVNKKTWKRI